MVVIKEVWKYRSMVSGLVRRELRGRYKGAGLGFFWTFLNPLLQLLVYSIVFSYFFDSGIEKYYLHLFVALIPWIFFSTSLAGGSGCVVGQSAMITKIYFPREIIPIAYTFSNFINMLYGFIVVFAVIMVSGVGLNLKVLAYFPLVVIIQLTLTLGITMLTSSITVYFRDLEHILGIVSMAWMYMTPIVYSIDNIPQKLRYLYNLNPMTPIILAYRDILYHTKAPDLKLLGLSSIFSVISLVAGFFVFSKLERRFAEVL